MHNTKFCTLLMALAVLVGALFLTPAFSSLMSNVAIRSSGTIATILPLHVEGRYIKNALGQTVVLRGINKHGFEDYPSGVWQRPDGSVTNRWEPETVKANLDAMRSWGMNHIRIHTAVNFWKYNIGNFRQNIKDLLTWAAERGMYVIFDGYSVVDYFSPGHQSDPIPYPPYTHEATWNVIGSKEEFVEWWASVADELKGFPNVIFDIWNEPRGDAEAKASFFDAVQQVINAIRATGATNLIRVQWDMGTWVNLSFPPPNNPASTMDWVESYPLYDPLGNIIYATHLYRNYGHIHRSVPERYNVWEYDEIVLGLTYLLIPYVLNTLNKPVIITEIGPNMWATGTDLERELIFYKNALAIFNEWGVSYTAFWWWYTGKYAHYTTPDYQPNEAGRILINALASP